MQAVVPKQKLEKIAQLAKASRTYVFDLQGHKKGVDGSVQDFSFFEDLVPPPTSVQARCGVLRSDAEEAQQDQTCFPASAPLGSPKESSVPRSPVLLPVVPPMTSSPPTPTGILPLRDINDRFQPQKQCASSTDPTIRPARTPLANKVGEFLPGCCPEPPHSAICDLPTPTSLARPSTGTALGSDVSPPERSDVRRLSGESQWRGSVES